MAETILGQAPPGGSSGPPPGHHPAPPPVHHPKPPRPPQPSHTARRAAVQAAQTAAVSPVVAPAVWQPWQKLVTQAEDAMRSAIGGALKELEQSQAAARQVLEHARQQADMAAGPLEDAAYSAWRAWTEAAEDVRVRLLGPAEAAYETAVDAGAARFGLLLDEASRSYDAAIAAADRARALAQAFPAP